MKNQNISLKYWKVLILNLNWRMFQNQRPLLSRGKYRRKLKPKIPLYMSIFYLLRVIIFLWFFEPFQSIQTHIDVPTFLPVMHICVSDILYASPYYYEKGNECSSHSYMQTIYATPTSEHDRRRHKGQVMGSTHIKPTVTTDWTTVLFYMFKFRF